MGCTLATAGPRARDLQWQGTVHISQTLKVHAGRPFWCPALTYAAMACHKSNLMMVCNQLRPGCTGAWAVALPRQHTARLPHYQPHQPNIRGPRQTLTMLSTKACSDGSPQQHTAVQQLHTAPHAAVPLAAAGPWQGSWACSCQRRLPAVPPQDILPPAAAREPPLLCLETMPPCSPEW